MRKVLSVQVPASCPLRCCFCRTPDHSQGDPAQVLATVQRDLLNFDEVYLTSTGETGLSPIFEDLVKMVLASDRRLSVLCATKVSVVPGLSRVEISMNPYTEPLALEAIKEARHFQIPIVISMVDEDSDPINESEVASFYGVDGVLVRALQAEGRSQRTNGVTRWFTRPGATLGHFPVAAYREFTGVGGVETTCVNHEGKIVSFLGAA